VTFCKHLLCFHSNEYENVSKEKSIQALPAMVNEAVQLSPFTEDKCIQATPLMAHKYSQTTNSTYFSQLKTPEQLSSSTGCNSFELFHALCAWVETYISTYAPNLSVGKSLTLQDQVLF